MLASWLRSEGIENSSMPSFERNNRRHDGRGDSLLPLIINLVVVVVFSSFVLNTPRKSLNTKEGFEEGARGGRKRDKDQRKDIQGHLVEDLLQGCEKQYPQCSRQWCNDVSYCACQQQRYTAMCRKEEWVYRYGGALTFHHTNLFMFVVHSVLWIAVVDKKILITLTNKISHITIGYDIFWLEERVYGVVVYFIHQEKLYGCEK
jgi:hypothetical protein